MKKISSNIKFVVMGVMVSCCGINTVGAAPSESEVTAVVFPDGMEDELKNEFEYLVVSIVRSIKLKRMDLLVKGFSPSPLDPTRGQEHLNRIEEDHYLNEVIFSSDVSKYQRGVSVLSLIARNNLVVAVFEAGGESERFRSFEIYFYGTDSHADALALLGANAKEFLLKKGWLKDYHAVRVGYDSGANEFFLESTMFYFETSGPDLNVLKYPQDGVG